MEDHEKKISISESVAMNGGDGPYSYSHNSSYQQGIAIAAMDKIKEALPKTLDVNRLSSSSPYPIIRIADFGCSSGLTSIKAVETIIYCLLDLIKPIEQPQFRTFEFQAIFNDLPTNDFNTLFTDLLPERRRYYAMAAPGSFHGRLLPTASLHFAYSSCALHWLSRVPQEILDKSSPAWNGERIYCVSSPAEVVRAYSAQFGRDMEAFLSARAEEMVSEGWMFMVVPGEPDLAHDSQTNVGLELELLGSCLVDMADTGIISKAKVESFNLPLYFPSEEELKQDQSKHILPHREDSDPEPPQSARRLFHPRVALSLLKSRIGGIIAPSFRRRTDHRRLVPPVLAEGGEISLFPEARKP